MASTDHISPQSDLVTGRSSDKRGHVGDRSGTGQGHDGDGHGDGLGTGQGRDRPLMDLYEEAMKRYCKHCHLTCARMLAERQRNLKEAFMDEEKEKHARDFADTFTA